VDASKSDTANLLNYLYNNLSDHWWTVGMRATTHTILRNNTNTKGLILEVGCGNGTYLSELSEKYISGAPIGIDINSHALEHAKNITNIQGSLLQGNFHHLPLAKNSVVLSIGLDAFDQSQVNLQIALAEIFRTLIKDGILLIRVSAHPWLLGQHDQSFGTGRRYTKSEICSGLRKAGFQIERFTYANCIMLLPAVITRLAIKLNLVAVENQFDTPRILNVLLTKILLLEASLLKLINLPAGLSIYILARKPK
tara:strand:- start:27903 stop:28661 length:759 start_codon:yes stop_codon:yes gene_type:complete